MAINFTTILPGGDFETFSIPHNPEDGSLQGRLLLAVDAAGRLEDHFRIVFGGGQKPSVNFSGANISDHPALTSFKFRIEADPESIDFKKNSFSSKWEDLEAMVAADRILVSSEQEEDAGPQFRDAWEAAKKAKKPAAAALRWSAQANAAYGFKLTLQALPGTARALRKDARLVKDTTRAIELAAWTASSPMANEGGGNGPVPIIFTPDAAATRANLVSHHDRLTTGKKRLK